MTATTTALVLADSRKSLFLAVSSSGSALGSVQTDTPLGIPAARGGVAFVPWSNQYVSALDMASGDESGRLLTREQVSRALNFGGQLYFGQRGLLRFDEKIRFASTNQATHVGLPKVDLPGKPGWIESGMQNATGAADARTKIRIYAAPAETAGGALTLGGGSFAASYFRVLLGLDAKSGALSWARSMPADVVGGAAARSGFVICDGDGKVWLLDKAGGDSGTLDLGSKVQLCVVDAGAEPIPSAAARGSIATQIAQTLDELEPDMAEAERYLVGELGKQSEPIVTKALIDLSSSPRISPELRTETRRLLAARKNGTEYMLAALERHYDFVSGVLLPPPPVGPLADALAVSGETRRSAAPSQAPERPRQRGRGRGARSARPRQTRDPGRSTRIFAPSSRCTAPPPTTTRSWPRSWPAPRRCCESAARAGGQCWNALHKIPDSGATCAGRCRPFWPKRPARRRVRRRCRRSKRREEAPQNGPKAGHR